VEVVSDPIVMVASIPPIMSALRVDGSGGARLQLDIPETEREAIKALLDMRGAELIVTIQRRELKKVEADSTDGSSEIDNRTARRPTDVARRRVQRPTD
jgi:hypothetical protein